MQSLIDAVLGMFRSLVGAPNVRDGEAHVQSFYKGAYPSWQKSTDRGKTPTLGNIPNGLNQPGAIPNPKVLANYRGAVISGTKRSWGSAK